MTLAEVKNFFRTVIKVVAGGPPVGTVGSNRAAGVLAALDKLVDFVASLVGAPQWVAGPQQQGALVYYNSATYRVQVAGLNSAQPPDAANTNYLLVGGGGGTGTVTSVNGIGPDSQGNVELPTGGPGTQYVELPAGTAVSIDLSQPAQVVSLTGNATFTTSDRAQGRAARLFLSNSTGAEVTLTWPAGWLWLGTKPTKLAAGKRAVLTLECVYGAAESDLVAGYAAQQ